MISVAPVGSDIALLATTGELFRLTSDGALVSVARLPPGHGMYNRTHVVAAPDGPPAVGPVEFPAVGGLDRRDHLCGPLVEHGDGQPGQVLEDRRVLPQVAQTRDHRDASRGPDASRHPTNTPLS
jgi:hypothetical protein